MIGKEQEFLYTQCPLNEQHNARQMNLSDGMVQIYNK